MRERKTAWEALTSQQGTTKCFLFVRVVFKRAAENLWNDGDYPVMSAHQWMSRVGHNTSSVPLRSRPRLSPGLITTLKSRSGSLRSWYQAVLGFTEKKTQENHNPKMNIKMFSLHEKLWCVEIGTVGWIFFWIGAATSSLHACSSVVKCNSLRGRGSGDGWKWTGQMKQMACWESQDKQFSAQVNSYQTKAPMPFEVTFIPFPALRKAKRQAEWSSKTCTYRAISGQN